MAEKRSPRSSTTAKLADDKRNELARQKRLISRLHAYIQHPDNETKRIGIIFQKTDGSLRSYDTGNNFGELLALTNTTTVHEGKVAALRCKPKKCGKPDKRIAKKPYCPDAAPISPPAAQEASIAPGQSCSYAGTSCNETSVSAVRESPMEITAYHNRNIPITSLLMSGGLCVPSASQADSSAGSSGTSGLSTTFNSGFKPQEYLPVVRLPWETTGDRYKHQIQQEDPYGKGGLLGDEQDEDEEEEVEEEEDDEEDD